MEEIIMELVVNSGAARSLAMEAIDLAAENQMEEAKAKIEEAKTMSGKAHSFQTELITKEANGEHQEMNLILVHGQDHLMTSMVVIDMTEKFMALYKKIN